MDGMNEREVIGGNNPPDPIDDICATYEAERDEALNWLDGSPVENEGQMHAVDALRKAMRNWRLDLERGQKAATAPLHDIYKAELERWKPTITDAKRFEDGLVAAVDGFKRLLLAEKAEAERRAREEARAKAADAKRLAREVNAADIDARRAADEAADEAKRAEYAARVAANDTVKGMRKVWRHEVTDHKALLHWIARNDKDAITLFVEDYARAHFKQGPMDGVNAFQVEEAY